MRRAFALTFGLLCAGLICLTQIAPAQILLTGAGARKTVAAVTFSGPGDVISGAVAWYSGSRCYSAAYANGTNKAVKLRRASDSAVQDIVCLTTGFVDFASASTFCNATTCFVNTLYDQSGGANDCVQATAGSQMAYGFSVFGSLGGVKPSATGPTFCETGGSLTQSQPFVVSYVAQRTIDNGGFNTVQDTAAGAVQTGLGNATGRIFLLAGSLQFVDGFTEGALHAVQTTYDGNPNSELYVDGAATGSLSPGTNGFSGIFRFSGNPNGCDCNIGEIGVWPGTWSSGQKSSMNTNQHSAANGYNF